MGELERLALACVFPGFPGLEPPEWVRRRLADGLGGVVLFAWNVDAPEQVASLTRAIRAERRETLVAIDEEGGDVTRLEAGSGSSYPGNLALGTVDDVALTDGVARAIGQDLLGVGIDLNLAPVADVNSNPDNPIIGVRSFGSDPAVVARHVAAFVRGLQSAGVAACAKHFPGHGDTAEDSHLALPTVAAVLEGALAPFRAAVAAGVQAVMTAHIRVRALGPEPATLSPTVLRGLLRDELGFEGLVVTDALEMRAISATVGVEEGAVAALAAGADSLCLGHDLAADAVDGVVRAIAGAVRGGRLAEERLAEAAGRVARVSAWTRTLQQTVAKSGVSVWAGVGLEAARRALLVEGDVGLGGRPPVVVELLPEPSIAAGPTGARLAAFLPSVADTQSGGRRVLVCRDLHRHEWQREQVEREPEAIVVEMGVPVWRPRRTRGYVATFGAGRANLQAAAERLTESAGRRLA